MTATTASTTLDTAAAGEPCDQCGFTLWNPVAALRVSTMGLYNDNRFPGRSLLSLNEHYADLTDLPEELLQDYMRDLRDVRTAITKVTGAARVNYAVLGNAEPHVHWHLVPRYPERESLPNRSPWQDPRPTAKLFDTERVRLVEDLAEYLR